MIALIRLWGWGGAALPPGVIALIRLIAPGGGGGGIALPEGDIRVVLALGDSLGGSLLIEVRRAGAVDGVEP